MLVVWTGRANFSPQCESWVVGGQAYLQFQVLEDGDHATCLAGAALFASSGLNGETLPQWIRCRTMEEDSGHQHWVFTCVHTHTCIHGHIWKGSVPPHLQACLYTFKQAPKRKKIMINRKWKRLSKQDSKLNYTSQIYIEVENLISVFSQIWSFKRSFWLMYFFKIANIKHLFCQL